MAAIGDCCVTDHSVLDHGVRSIIELEIGDSASRLYFEHACITLLESFDPNALTVTNSREIEGSCRTALIGIEGAYFELINSVIVGA